jgi:hypothetical protein
MITAGGFAQDSDYGVPLRTTWNNYQYWSEFGSFLLLVRASNYKEFEILNTTEIPDWQRQQLREILTLVLPKK